MIHTEGCKSDAGGTQEQQCSMKQACATLHSTEPPSLPAIPHDNAISRVGISYRLMEVSAWLVRVLKALAVAYKLV